MDNQESNTNKTKQVAKNTFFLYIRMIVVMLVTLYTSRVVLQALGFSDYGIYNVVASIVVFLNFLQAALRNATFRYTTYEIGRGDNGRLNQVYSMAINSHLLLGVIVVILLELVGVWFLNTHLNIPKDRMYAANWVFQFSLITVFISIVRTPFESLILAYERMDFYAIISIVEVLFKLAIVYLLSIIFIDKLILYSILLAFITLFLSIGYYLYCKRVFYDCQYIIFWDNQLLLDFTRYSGWSLLVNGACMARSQCITFFFNIFLGLIANAALGIANQIINALNMFVTNFTQAFNPQIVKSWASSEYDYFMRIIYISSKLSYYLLLLVCIPVIVNIDFILQLWLGDYPEYTDVYIETIVFYYLVEAMQTPLVTAVHATGKLKQHQIIISSVVFAFIPISYFLLRLGYSGTYVLGLNAVTNLLCAIARVLIMRNLINLDLNQYTKIVLRPIVLVSFISLLVVVFFKYTSEDNWQSFIVSCILSVIAVIISSYYLGIDKQERHALNLLLKKR